MSTKLAKKARRKFTAAFKAKEKWPHLLRQEVGQEVGAAKVDSLKG